MRANKINNNVFIDFHYQCNALDIYYISGAKLIINKGTLKRANCYCRYVVNSLCAFIGC